MKDSPLELLFDVQLEQAGLPAADLKDCALVGSPKAWRYDRIWTAQGVIVEIEGGVWSQGRHTRGKGFIEDCTKYNWATSQGWRLFRFTEWHLNKNLVVPFMRGVLV